MYMGWSVSKRDRVLVNGKECYFPGGMVVYRMGC